VVGVRHPSERAEGFITGSLHEPLHELPGCLGNLPQRPLWVHCRGSYRASIAASLLQAAGHTVTVIDDDFARAADAGLPLTWPSRPTPAAEVPTASLRAS
jgi:hydroxyacylglutathione hydrolase